MTIRRMMRAVRRNLGLVAAAIYLPPEQLRDELLKAATGCADRAAGEQREIKELRERVIAAERCIESAQLMLEVDNARADSHARAQAAEIQKLRDRLADPAKLTDAHLATYVRRKALKDARELVLSWNLRLDAEGGQSDERTRVARLAQLALSERIEDLIRREAAPGEPSAERWGPSPMAAIYPIIKSIDDEAPEQRCTTCGAVPVFGRCHCSPRGPMSPP